MEMVGLEKDQNRYGHKMHHAQVPGMSFFFFSCIKLLLIILTKTDTLCREMEVAGAKKGQKE